MRKVITATLVVALGTGCTAAGTAGSATPAGMRSEAHRFVTCENHAGAGFFWLDSTSGELWWASPGEFGLVSAGKPPGSEPGSIGRYRGQPNKNGGGLFVLDTATGAAWWTDAKVWRALERR